MTAYDTINNLAEMAFIAGTEKVLNFTAYAENGTDYMDISGSTITWKLCPYGSFDVVTLTVPGVAIDAFHFTVTVGSTGTAALSGKYLQQITIVDAIGQTFTPGQGVVTIAPKIGAS